MVNRLSKARLIQGKKPAKHVDVRGLTMRSKWTCTAFALIAASVPFSVAATGPVAVKVQIEEWHVSAPNSRPHDPAAGPDGSLWYTGQQSNTLGRLDPTTGKITEYPVKTPNSGPHGLVADMAGNIWFTANYKGYIGKLNPLTGEVVEYPMPDPNARDPHSLAFDQKGMLWFTVQTGNFVGRLDPQTGAIGLKASPTPNSKPYGIAVNSKGIPFFCELGTNKLARVNPKSMEITEYLLPPGARPRRLAIAADDAVYYTDYSRGYLARLNPDKGKIEEWSSPGGRESRPYGIAITPDGTVWYSESGVTPNTIVRFDPVTRTFATWPVPSGGGTIRNMVATLRGDLYIACSGVNTVGVVKVVQGASPKLLQGSSSDGSSHESAEKVIEVFVYGFIYFSHFLRSCPPNAHVELEPTG
jgi:virginiamycin B lyase